MDPMDTGRGQVLVQLMLNLVMRIITAAGRIATDGD